MGKLLVPLPPDDGEGEEGEGTEGVADVSVGDRFPLRQLRRPPESLGIEPADELIPGIPLKALK